MISSQGNDSVDASFWWYDVDAVKTGTSTLSVKGETKVLDELSVATRLKISVSVIPEVGVAVIPYMDGVGILEVGAAVAAVFKVIFTHADWEVNSAHGLVGSKDTG